MGTEDRITLAECRVHVEHLLKEAHVYSEHAAELRRMATRLDELATAANVSVMAYRRQADGMAAP